MNSTLHRPKPLLSPRAVPVDATRSADRAAERLEEGDVLLVTDHYRTGVEILEALRRQMDPPAADAPYDARQRFQRAWRQAARRLLVPIEDHGLALQTGPFVGFLKELYPGMRRFALPLVAVQELNQAWNRYKVGVPMAVIGRRLHPFYGTYTPSRTTHLELFATWLSQYHGRRVHAVDVGTGSGVIGFMLARAGFASVLSTDTNPNAIESVRRELEGFEQRPPIDLVHGDLLGDDDRPADLVVFNPPWTRGRVDDLLNRALHYEGSLFQRFFDQACDSLAPGGRIVLVFSNVIELLQPGEEHPIEAELRKGRLQLVQKMQRRVKPGRDAQGNKRKTREKVEVWELARA